MQKASPAKSRSLCLVDSADDEGGITLNMVEQANVELQRNASATIV
ncbi:hypothetical protein [Bradyrhizobium sp. BR13661]|jgi:hypothetical protein|nr:hypothetical protein [Bradyrhizobium sp. BR13661]MDH6263577.1 hypothetical protein [Bradyrhizobium sp. BR13661]